jgi:autotransporter-associated beta strand protein
MNRVILAATRCSLIFVLPAVAYAGSAQWDLNPTCGDWNTAANWTPMTVPNGPADIATFALSNTTNVSISANTQINSVTFTPATTNPYTITAGPAFTLALSATGIMNNSGITQTFVAADDGTGGRGQIVFRNSATAGTFTIFVNSASAAQFVQGGETTFYNTSTAANGTFMNEGGTLSGSEGGTTSFYDSSTAANGSFTNSGGVVFNTFSAATVFSDTSTAANGTFSNDGGAAYFADGGQTIFSFNSTAANGTFVNNGATASGGFGGATSFYDSSSAGNGNFTNNGGTASGVAALGGGNTIFSDTSTAANGTFVNNGATFSGGEGGVTEFGTSPSDGLDSPTAANGTFINNGATVSGAIGGQTAFYETSSADSATLIANSGTGGGEGGQILFDEASTGARSRVGIFGNASLDVSNHNAPGVTIGSIEGDGDAFLGPNNLTVGSNNVNTIFSGVIQDGGFGGSLTKVGPRALDLTGANTYTGDTNLDGGVLQVDGSISSNTFVNPSGTLAGSGTVNGNVTNNNAGKLTPGDALGVPGVLTVADNYTQTRGATLVIQIGGAGAGQVSVLNVQGNANLNGFLDPVLVNGFVPEIGQSFTFMNYASFTGFFSRMRSQLFDHGRKRWQLAYNPTSAVLFVVRNGSSRPR